MNDGWGLTTDGKILFGSDGSSTLYQMDPQTMKGTHLSFLIYLLCVTWTRVLMLNTGTRSSVK